MNEKDLMKGLSHVDEDLIAEANAKKKHRTVKVPVSVAAGVCLAVLAGGIWGGSTILRQQQEISSLSAAEDVAEDMEASSTQESGGRETVGIAFPALGRFSTVSSYTELYVQLAERSTDIQSGYGIVKETAAAEAEEAASDSVAPSSSNDGSEDYSTTNLMTEGVDESDIIKTDGSFLYMVQSGSVKIVDIRQGAAGDSVQVTPPFASPSDTIRELYVDGDRMILIVEHAEKKSTSVWTPWVHSSSYKDETYAYIYDITDPQNAELMGSMKQDGSYNTSRKVGDLVYLFTDQWIRTEGVNENTAEREGVLTEWVPAVNDVPVSSDCIYLPESGRNSLVISSFDVKDPDTCIDAKVIINNYSSIYMGNGHIYLCEMEWTGNRELTTITSVVYEDGEIRMEAENHVGGMITDAFAIHEMDQGVSILTTDYSSYPQVNTLYVMDKELQLTGRIDEIARGEDVYAARYVGDMVYFITYRNADPMFVADLSDPEDPILLGEVEITGFSDYLHPWDETHVLGIGYETTEDSDRMGMKLVMFDVTDPAEPIIENTLVLVGGLDEYEEYDRWFYSAAVSSNYKAILADPVKNLIGFGYTADGWSDQRSEEVSIYELVSYDADKGFKVLRSMDMDEDWYVGDTRGLYSGDWFYLGCYGEVRSFNMADGYTESK